MAINVLLGLSALSTPGVTLRNDEHRGPRVQGVPTTCELKSYHFALKNPLTPTSGSGGAGGRPATFDALTVTKQVDALSPGLMSVCAMGAHFEELKLCLLKDDGARSKAGPVAYSTFSMKMATIAGIEWSTSNVDDVAEEHVTFEFRALQAEVRPVSANGAVGQPVVGAWSVALDEAKYSIT